VRSRLERVEQVSLNAFNEHMNPLTDLVPKGLQLDVEAVLSTTLR
jgi:hypothetical protein